jgi:hypothetical protein
MWVLDGVIFFAEDVKQEKEDSLKKGTAMTQIPSSLKVLNSTTVLPRISLSNL